MRVALLVLAVSWGLCGCPEVVGPPDDPPPAPPDASPCGGSGVLRTIFADFASDGVDARLWRTNATIENGNLALRLGGQNSIASQNAVNLDEPVVIELGAIETQTLSVSVGRVGFIVSGGELVVHDGDTEILRDTFVPARDRILTVEPLADGVKVSTADPDGNAGLSASASGEDPLGIGGISIIAGGAVDVVAIARTAAPQPYCPAEHFQPDLTNGDPGPECVAVADPGCATAETAAGLAMTLADTGPGVLASYSSTAAFAPPSTIVMRFVPSDTFAEEPLLAVGDVNVSVTHGAANTDGMRFLGSDYLDPNHTSLTDARQLRLTFTPTSVRAEVLDDADAQLVVADVEREPPLGAVIHFGFTATSQLQAPTTATIVSVVSTSDPAP